MQKNMHQFVTISKLLSRYSNLLKNEYSIQQTNVQSWRTTTNIFLSVLLFLSFGFGVAIAYLGTSISFLKSLYWYSASLILSVIVLGTWAVFNNSDWLRRKFEEDGTMVLPPPPTTAMPSSKKGTLILEANNKRNCTTNEVQRYVAGSDVHLVAPEATVYFSKQESRKNGASQSVQVTKNKAMFGGSVSFGPKLANPRNKGKKVSTDKLPVKASAKKKKSAAASKQTKMGNSKNIKNRQFVNKVDKTNKTKNLKKISKLKTLKILALN